MKLINLYPKTFTTSLLTFTLAFSAPLFCAPQSISASNFQKLEGTFWSGLFRDKLVSQSAIDTYGTISRLSKKLYLIALPAACLTQINPSTRNKWFSNGLLYTACGLVFGSLYFKQRQNKLFGVRHKALTQDYDIN